MKLRDCIGCGRVVLELRGQFSLLDSFYIEDGVPAPESAGEWHLRCLRESGFGAAWYAARRRNFVDVRRYDLVAETDDWTVVRNPRTGEALGHSRTGEALGLTFEAGRSRRVDGGGVYGVDEEYNLELDDRDIVKTLQDSLLSVGSFPLFALIEVLGIADRISHPEALEGSLLRFDRGLRGDWNRRRGLAKAPWCDGLRGHRSGVTAQPADPPRPPGFISGAPACKMADPWGPRPLQQGRSWRWTSTPGLCSTPSRATRRPAVARPA